MALTGAGKRRDGRGSPQWRGRRRACRAPRRRRVPRGALDHDAARHLHRRLLATRSRRGRHERRSVPGRIYTVDETTSQIEWERRLRWGMCLFFFLRAAAVTGSLSHSPLILTAAGRTGCLRRRPSPVSGRGPATVSSHSLSRRPIPLRRNHPTATTRPRSGTVSSASSTHETCGSGREDMKPSRQRLFINQSGTRPVRPRPGSWTAVRNAGDAVMPTRGGLGGPPWSVHVSRGGLRGAEGSRTWRGRHGCG